MSETINNLQDITGASSMAEKGLNDVKNIEASELLFKDKKRGNNTMDRLLEIIKEEADKLQVAEESTKPETIPEA